MNLVFWSIRRSIQLLSAARYFRARVPGETHGSRAIVVVCRSEETASKRFGIAGQGTGVCFTRTGRRFFNDISLESEFLSCLSGALTDARFWEDLKTEWIILDCELMPWSAKAQELLKDQYAAVGAAASISTSAAQEALAKAQQRVWIVPPFRSDMMSAGCSPDSLWKRTAGTAGRQTRLQITS